MSKKSKIASVNIDLELNDSVYGAATFVVVWENHHFICFIKLMTFTRSFS